MKVETKVEPKVETKIDKKRIKCLRMNDFHFIKVINNKILSK